MTPLSQDKMYSVVQNQLELNTKVVNLNNINIPQLVTPFLRQRSGSVEITEITIENVECSNAGLNFCLFQINSNQEIDDDAGVSNLTIQNATIQNINSVAPLTTSYNSQFAINYSNFTNIRQLENDEPMFYFENSKASFEKFSLTNLENSIFMTAVDSQGYISQATFKNDTQTKDDFILVSNSQVNVVSSDDIYSSLTQISEQESSDTDEVNYLSFVKIIFSHRLIYLMKVQV